MRRAVFGATILLGAFLLFQVQPLLSRWILPWFGGGPAVWTTCMLFFQSLLFAGYAYAHGLSRHPPLLHLVLVGAACALLPLRPAETAAPEGDPTWPILKLLAAAAGLPCLLLASTGPLVQAWAARSDPDRPPYRLYALSNLGSLAALLSYPFLVEPRLGLRAQSAIWTWTFAAFAALSAASALLVRRTPAPAAGSAPFRWIWVALPALASALLLATTNQLSEDVVVLPFLWVLPLTVYLVSFIVVFDRPAWYRPEVVAPATAVLAFAAAAVHYQRPDSALPGISVDLAVLLGVCLLCHGELARLKPGAGGLTGYYLAIAGGGAVGGILVSIVAPLLFSTVFEWKLGMGVAYAGAWAMLGWLFRGWFRSRLNIAAVVVVVASLGLAFQISLLATYGRALESVRNFYGAVTVTSTGEGADEVRDLLNGRVLHGRQYFDEKRRRVPTTYYAAGSGVGRAIAFFKSPPDLSLGVVGLGVGTLAAYATSAGQTVRFYEINPEVARIARERFTYLADCRGRVDAVAGDARVTLGREAPRGYHVLALDAFSGHTVPTHLLTREAMRLYARQIRADGIVAMHVSNQHLRLGPVVRGAARRCGLETLRIEGPDGGEELGSSSTWILCTRNAAALRELKAYATEDQDGPDVVWTDDASDLFSILK